MPMTKRTLAARGAKNPHRNWRSCSDQAAKPDGQPCFLVPSGMFPAPDGHEALLNQDSRVLDPSVRPRHRPIGLPLP